MRNFYLGGIFAYWMFHSPIIGLFSTILWCILRHLLIKYCEQFSNKEVVKILTTLLLIMTFDLISGTCLSYVSSVPKYVQTGLSCAFLSAIDYSAYNLLINHPDETYTVTAKHKNTIYLMLKRLINK